VLGGIGPEATNEFYGKLIDKLQKTGNVKSNTDFPQIIINSIPAPELVNDKIPRKDLEPYIKGLKELDRMNVDFIVMVCNTIHLLYESLQKEVKTQIIDLREEVKNVLRQNKESCVLILGTPSIVKKDLYNFKGIKSCKPNNEELKEISKAILKFNMGEEKEKQIRQVRTISNKYIKQGAETIILGCTELSLMLSKEKINKINTIDVLAEATVRRFSRLNNTPPTTL